MEGNKNEYDTQAHFHKLSALLIFVRNENLTDLDWVDRDTDAWFADFLGANDTFTKAYLLYLPSILQDAVIGLV